MFDIRKLFARASRGPDSAPGHDPDSDYQHASGEGLEVEYAQLVAAQLRRSGISLRCTTVEVRKLGQAPDGFDVFVGMLRLHRWDRSSALRLLVGLPLLEARVRRAVRGTWLADYSHFGGLWLHASEQLQSSPGPAELRQLLLALTAPPAEGTSLPPGARESTTPRPVSG